MRVGIDARLWSEGGVGRYIRNLIRHLQVLDKKNEYVLFSISEKSDEILHFVQNGNFIVEKADIRWHTIDEQLRMPTVLNQHNLDIVHFPYPSVPMFYNRPFVVTIHDLIPYHYPTGYASTLPLPLYWIKQLGYRLVLSQAIKKAKKVIAVSQTTKSEIIDHFGVSSSKIVVMYEGVDTSVQSSKLKVKSSRKEKQYFLYVGNAYPHKNLERLLEVFQLVCQYDIRLILVGKDDYFYKRLQEGIVHQGLKKHIEVRTDVSDAELATLYHNALALVSPSLMEGFDLPVVEAMANGCLVVASDIAVHREVAGSSAVYFDPYDTDDLHKKMKSLCYHDLNHDNNIHEGLQRAGMFSWEKMAKETLAAYESCVGVRSGE